MERFHKWLLLLLAGGWMTSAPVLAQNDVRVSARTDAAQILVGDQARIFLELQHDPALSRVDWPFLPDSLNQLEIVEKGRIDTLRNGTLVTYRQRLLVTGFDSGRFVVPPFRFPVRPVTGQPYLLSTDSIPLLVQTVPVDTTKPFHAIKEIMPVKSSWTDYLWLLIGCLLFLGLVLFVLWYFIRKKRAGQKPTPSAPPVSLQERSLGLLAALESEQLWQKGLVKPYYVQLTDIVRGYLEARFNTPALELTTDELLEKTRVLPELIPVASFLQTILQTADLAKFAKAEPLPAEHLAAMTAAKDLILATTPRITPESSLPS